MARVPRDRFTKKHTWRGGLRLDGAAAACLPVALVRAFVNVEAARVARLRLLASQMEWGETSDERRGTLRRVWYK